MTSTSSTTLAKETVDGVQSLIQVNLDSSEGFKHAADKIEHDSIATMFRECSARRAGFARELQQTLTEHGAEAPSSGSVKGTLHRWWLDLRGTVSSGDEHSVLSEAERGEDAIKQKYETVLKDTAGSPFNAMLQRQYTSVKADHDTIRDMRDARS